MVGLLRHRMITRLSEVGRDVTGYWTDTPPPPASHGQKECVILTHAASRPLLGTLLRTVRSTQTRIVHKSAG
jgi:hypothetical protein